MEEEDTRDEAAVLVDGLLDDLAAAEVRDREDALLGMAVYSMCASIQSMFGLVLLVVGTNKRGQDRGSPARRRC